MDLKYISIWIMQCSVLYEQLLLNNFCYPSNTLLNDLCIFSEGANVHKLTRAGIQLVLFPIEDMSDIKFSFSFWPSKD